MNRILMSAFEPTPGKELGPETLDLLLGMSVDDEILQFHFYLIVFL